MRQKKTNQDLTPSTKLDRPANPRLTGTPLSLAEIMDLGEVLPTDPDKATAKNTSVQQYLEAD